MPAKHLMTCYDDLLLLIAKVSEAIDRKDLDTIYQLGEQKIRLMAEIESFPSNDPSHTTSPSMGPSMEPPKNQTMTQLEIRIRQAIAQEDQNRLHVERWLEETRNGLVGLHRTAVALRKYAGPNFTGSLLMR